MGLIIKRTLSAFMCLYVVLSVMLYGSYSTKATGNVIGDFKGYNVQIKYDNNSVYFTAVKDNDLYVKDLTIENKEYNLSFDDKVIDFSINKGVIYTITRSTLMNGLYFLHRSDKTDSAVDFQINLNRVPYMVVNNSGYMFLLNNKKNVCVFDLQGKLVTENMLNANRMFSLNGNAYVTTFKDICKLSENKFTSQYKYDGNGDIYGISETYFANMSGEIYKLSNSINKVTETENYALPFCGETNKYLVSYSNDNIVAYDKNTGIEAYKYNIGYKPCFLSASKNKIIAVNKENNTFSYDTYYEDSVFATDNNDKVVSKSKAKLDFKGYKLKGRYIFVPYKTTNTSLKNSINYNGYSIDFNKTNGIIGTNRKVIFTHNNKSKTFTFIVLGDLTGEGNINTRDRKTMFDYFLENEDLSKPFMLSGDMNKDNKISNIDLVMLERKRESLLN